MARPSVTRLAAVGLIIGLPPSLDDLNQEEQPEADPGLPPHHLAQIEGDTHPGHEREQTEGRYTHDQIPCIRLDQIVDSPTYEGLQRHDHQQDWDCKESSWVTEVPPLQDHR